MRKIKFRGKDIESGKWLFGSLVTHRDDTAFLADGFIQSQVDPQTVGEFTGLQDVAGKDIYEGDIIQSVNHLTEIFEVAMIDGAFRILAEGFKGEDLYRTLKHDNFKVIGNIHDNPDLLEGVD